MSVSRYPIHEFQPSQSTESMSLQQRLIFHFELNGFFKDSHDGRNQDWIKKDQRE